MERGKVDLRKCKKGDLLISALGAQLKYIEQLPEKDWMDHIVEYLPIPRKFEGFKEISSQILGRTNDGYVFRNKTS